MMYGFDGHGWGMGWWWIIGLIILVIVIWILVRSFNKSTSTNKKTRKTALEILEERYAKGKIDKEEFESRKTDLTKDKNKLNEY